MLFKLKTVCDVKKINPYLHFYFKTKQEPLKKKPISQEPVQFSS